MQLTLRHNGNIKMRLAWITLCLLLTTGALLAQGDRGTITGTIQDSTGAVISEASITATNVETGANYNTKSTTTGNYTLSQLPTGSYKVSVESQGFKTYVRSGITVPVAQTLRIDVPL